jgi:hypothetical protein
VGQQETAKTIDISTSRLNVVGTRITGGGQIILLMVRGVVNASMMTNLIINELASTKAIGLQPIFVTLLCFRLALSHNPQNHITIPRMQAISLFFVLTCGKPVENPHPPVESLWILWGKVREKIRINFITKRYI